MLIWFTRTDVLIVLGVGLMLGVIVTLVLVGYVYARRL